MCADPLTESEWKEAFPAEEGSVDYAIRLEVLRGPLAFRTSPPQLLES